MLNKITIFDPMMQRKHIIDFNEFRFVINIEEFKHQFSTNPQFQAEFQSLDGLEKENMLKIIDNLELKVPYKAEAFSEIEGLDIRAQLVVRHTGDAYNFFDEINQQARDREFNEKQHFEQTIQSLAFIGPTTFPMTAQLVTTEDFYKGVDIKAKEGMPIFENYISNGTDFPEKFVINSKGDIEPIFQLVPVFKEPNWEYFLEIVLTPTTPLDNLVWLNVPNIKILYDFFEDRGYIYKQNNIHRTLFIHEELGNVIEYNHPQGYLYQPFLSVKEANRSTELTKRKKLGDKLQIDLDKTGLSEEIQFFRGYLLETEAIGKLQNKNKRPSDEALSMAISEYDQCKGLLKSNAQLEAIFSAWIKNRIAVHVGDEQIKQKSYENILARYAQLHRWEDFAWFLDFVESIDKKQASVIVKEFLPIAEIDKYYLMGQETYKTILEYWNTASKKEKLPEKKYLAEWYYQRAKQAYEIGLKESARTYLNKFFQTAKSHPEYIEWAYEGTEELLDFSVELDLRRQYKSFAQKMADYLFDKKKSKGIGDMSSIKRKEYRWELFLFSIAQSRWQFHTGYILTKENPDKTDKAIKYLTRAYDTFLEAIHHYDISEEYSEKQTETIGKGLVMAYNLAFQLRSNEILVYVQELARQLWDKHPSKDLYAAMQTIFSKEERKEMADFLIGSWIQEVTDREGSFSLDKEKIRILSNLYLSVEEWSNCGDTLKFGLEKFDWSFEELNDLFVIYHSLYKYNFEEAEKVTGIMFEWIQKELDKKTDQSEYARDVRARIKNLTDLK